MHIIRDPEISEWGNLYIRRIYVKKVSL
jgi:hypothetical protein